MQPEKDDDAVLYHCDQGVGIVTLNRGDNRNSMTAELLDGFAAAIDQARRDADLRCLVITGKGRCFSAGADFRAQIQRDEGALPHQRSLAMYQPFFGVLEVEVPVIAALNGHAVGGGFGLALVSDIRIAHAESRYGANFTRLGLHPGMGVTYLLPRLVGVARAAELLFTGRLFSGTEMAAMGLATEAVAADEVLPKALELAATIAANAPIAVRATKQTLYELMDWDVRRGGLREALIQAETVATEDAVEGMKALLEKRDPRFQGR